MNFQDMERTVEGIDSLVAAHHMTMGGELCHNSVNKKFKLMLLTYIY